MKLILSSLLLFLTLNVNAADVTKLQVDASQPTFQVELAANPTTGFRWELKYYDKKRFEMVGSEYVFPETRLLGAGGKRIYTFKLKAQKSYPKKTKMLFRYARPWDKSSSTSSRVIIYFSKKPASQPQKNKK